MKNLIFLISICLISLTALSQNQSVRLGSNTETLCYKKQEKKLIKKFKKMKCNQVSDSLKLIFIHHYGFVEKPTKNLFLENEMFSKIRPLYRIKGSFPISYGIVYDENKIVVGNFEENNVYCDNKVFSASGPGQINRNLLKYYLDNEIDEIFKVDSAPSDVFFSQRNEELNVIIFQVKKHGYVMKTMDIDYFLENHWNDVFPEVILNDYYNKF